MNLLSVQQLSKSFGDKVLFRNINFGINHGDKVALIAKNGSGKSTLFKILQGIEIPDSGEVAFRKDVRISFLSQEPKLNPDHTIEEAIYESDSLPIKTAMDYARLSETHYTHPTPEGEKRLDELTERMNTLELWDVETKIKTVLSKFGLSDMQQQVNTLSGGQKKRLSLAQVLLNEPDLLIMDEPTNHLDIDVIEWLEQYLYSYNKSLLLVTHDRYFLNAVCNRIIEIDNQQVYEYKGNFEYYIEKKAERMMMEASELEKAKNLYRRELEWVRKMPKARTTKSKSRVDAFYEVEQKARQKRQDKKIELNVKVERLGSKIIELIKISKAFGPKKIMDGFTYTFKKGEKIGIVGRNGVGKSTFLNILQGLEAPDAGKIQTGETVIFGYYSQGGIQVSDDKRIIEVVTDIAEYIPLANGTMLKASQLLTRFNFPPDVQYSYVRKLSGGEKRRLYLLTVLVKNPNFLILDEPTNDLDIVTLQTLEEFLMEFQGCVLLVSHDRYFLDKLVDHVFAFEGNGLIKDYPGNYSEYRDWKEEQESLPVEEAPAETVSNDEPAIQVQTPPAKNAEKKLSYKEQRELEQLEKDLGQLEERKKAIETLMSGGTASHQELANLSEEFKSISTAIDDKTMRWLELQD